MALGSIKVRYVELESTANVWPTTGGNVRLWVNANDNNNLYAQDESGSNTQVLDNGALATGNAQYLWDWFENGTLNTIDDFSVVRLVSGGPKDGTLALADSDAVDEDNFLGIVFGGSISPSSLGKVIYSGKVPGAVAGLGLPSMTTIYMDNVPGAFTSTLPNFQTNTIFQIGFTKGDDLYLRPAVRSDIF